MHEPSDGIAEEVERQLQLALAAAAIAARRAIAARQHAIEQATRERQGATAVQAQIEAQPARDRARTTSVRSRVVGDSRAARHRRHVAARQQLARARP